MWRSQSGVVGIANDNQDLPIDEAHCCIPRSTEWAVCKLRHVFTLGVSGTRISRPKYPLYAPQLRGATSELHAVCTEDDSRIGIGGCNKGLMDAQEEGEKRPSNRPLKREAQLLAQPRILTQTCMVDGHRSQNEMPARRCCGYRCISVQARLSSLFSTSVRQTQATAVFPHAMPASWTLPKTPTIPRYTSYGILEISRRADDLSLLG